MILLGGLILLKINKLGRAYRPTAGLFGPCVILNLQSWLLEIGPEVAISAHDHDSPKLRP